MSANGQCVMLQDDKDQLAKERQSKWRMKCEDEEPEPCPNCSALEEKVEELAFELEAERHGVEETIRLVEKMELEHKRELEKLNYELNFEKDKVAALHNTLEHERQARMQEIYKQDRQTLEYGHGIKDYNLINEKNSNLSMEFDAVRNENETLIKLTDQLQKNKLDIVEQMKAYEREMTELEKKINVLRKRLYDSDNEKDRHKIQCAKMKQKLQDYMNGIGERTQPKVKSSQSLSLGPLQSFNKVSHNCVFSHCMLFIYCDSPPAMLFPCVCRRHPCNRGVFTAEARTAVHLLQVIGCRLLVWLVIKAASKLRAPCFPTLGCEGLKPPPSSAQSTTSESLIQTPEQSATAKRLIQCCGLCRIKTVLVNSLFCCVYCNILN
jgi:hypothetical protein